MEPEEKVGIISVKCTPKGESKTEVSVTYHYTGLSDSGDAFVMGYTAKMHETYIKEWEELLKRYFNSRKDTTE